MPFLVGAALLVSSCRADVSINVMVENDGSGVVRVELLLDEAATASIVDLERSGLALSDMAQTGWRLAGTEKLEDGGSRTIAAKDFGTARQFAEIMDELSGEDGILQDFELQRNRSFARVEYNVSGRIDTTKGLDSFADTELQELLDISVEQATEDYNVSPDNVGIEVSVGLPGDITEGQTKGLISVKDDQTTVRWAVDLASDKVSNVQATSETRKVSALVFRGLAVVAGVIAGLLVLAQLFRQFGSDKDQKKPGRKLRQKKPRGATSTSNAAATPAVSVVDDTVDPVTAKAVILDGMGVLYREGDDINKLLIPFVRSRGSIQTNDEIWSKARAMSLGRLTANQFWKDVGLTEEATVLDREYVSNHQLSPGVVRYMRALRANDVRVGCVVNGATTWAEGLRVAHSLGTLIDPWIVSGSVGVRKPDGPLLEVVRRLCELPPGLIRIVDDDLDILDTVRSHGYLTAWYNPDGTAEESRGHALMKSFDSEVARLAKESGGTVNGDGR